MVQAIPIKKQWHTCLVSNITVNCAITYTNSTTSNSDLVLVYGIKCTVVSQQSALHDHQRGGGHSSSVHTFICSSVYTFSHTLTHLPSHTHTPHIHTHLTHTHTSHTHPYTYPHINVHTFICSSVYTFSHTLTHTSPHTHTLTPTHT